MTKIALKDLRPNPFRHLERLPAKPAKVEALKESIKETTFWDNIVCRKAPNGSGGFEIAYGHNRLEALKQLKYVEVDIPVRELDNNAMAKIMARENNEEWGSAAEVDAETARAIVYAYAEGKIDLPSPGPRGQTEDQLTQVRIAPSFKMQSAAHRSSGQKIYTIQQVAEFLGWNMKKTENILSLLSFQEDDIIGRIIDFASLTPSQAASVVRQVKRVRKETEDDKMALRIGKQLVSDFRAVGDKPRSRFDSTNRRISSHTAEERANQLMRETRVKRHIEKRKVKEAKFSLLNEDRQVGDFLDACKVWERALEKASASIIKFSPEARRFTIRRLNIIRSAETLLKGKLGQ